MTKNSNPESPVRFLVAVASALLCLGAAEAGYRRSGLPELIVPTDVYQAKRRDHAAKGGADVVFVGSSRVYHGVVAPLVARMASEALGQPVTAYNFGVPAGDLPGYLLTAEDVLRPGLARPRLFVFGMSPIEWTCCPATSVPSSPKWVASIRPYHAWPLLASASDPEEAFTDLTAGLFHAYAARTHVLNKVRGGRSPEGWADVGSWGWVSFGYPVDPPTQHWRASGRAEAYRPNFYPPKHFDRAGTHRYFMAAIARLRSEGVPVAIFGTPQARQLDRNNDAASYYPEYVKYMEKAALEQGSAFVNFTDFPGLVNGDFGDGDHLVESGATKFTRQLTERVVIPALRRERPSPL